MSVERHSSIDALAEEWDALAERTGATPFDYPGWIAAWWAAFGAGRLEVVAVREGGELTAVLPLVRRTRGVRLPTNGHSPSFAPIGSEDGIAEACDAVFAPRPVYVWARFVTSAAPLRSSAKRHGYATVERVAQRSPYVRLEGFSLGDRAQARIRRLGRRGHVELDVVDGADGLAEPLRRAFELEASGWKSALRTAIASDPRTVRFYTEIAAWAAKRGMLRLVFLRLDGRPIAADIVLLHGGRTYDLKGGYDPEFARYSPGLVLQAMLIEWAAAHGCATHELLGDAEQWKLEWTDLVRPRFELVALGGGIGARIALGALARAVPAARLAGRQIMRRRAIRARGTAAGRR